MKYFAFFIFPIASRVRGLEIVLNPNEGCVKMKKHSRMSLNFPPILFVMIMKAKKALNRFYKLP